MTGDEINFDDNAGVNQNSDNGLSASDFLGGNFLKNPPVGETLILDIVKIVPSDKTEGKNKETGKTFTIGLKQKNGKVKRYDIECVNDGVYTISNWEIFFKLLGPKGLLMGYAKEHNGSFAGAKVAIKRLIDGGHANLKPQDLSKILNVSVPEAEKKISEIKAAIKEQRLFEVTMVA